MSKEVEELDENKFEGFNILKADGLAAPDKAVKTKKDKEEVSDDDAKEKEINDALEAAKKEVDDAAAKKSGKKTIDESAEENQED